MSNLNLLDNPWFTVNQRAQSSYTNTSGFSESVDRWKIANRTTLAVVSGGVTLTSTSEISFLQNTEYNLRGETVTASVKVGGVVYSGTTTVPSSGYNLVTLSINGLSVDIRVGYSSGLYFRINVDSSTASLTLQAVKLELGAISTLANDIAPNYTTELLKCQRYYQQIKITSSTMPFGFGIAVSDTVARIFIPLSVRLRATPTVSVLGAFYCMQDAGYVSTSNISIAEVVDNGITIAVAGTGFVSLKPTVLTTSTNVPVVIQFSADL